MANFIIWRCTLKKTKKKDPESPLLRYKPDDDITETVIDVREIESLTLSLNGTVIIGMKSESEFILKPDEYEENEDDVVKEIERNLRRLRGMMVTADIDEVNQLDKEIEKASNTKRERISSQIEIGVSKNVDFYNKTLSAWEYYVKRSVLSL